jgi:hypothetical protein
MASFFAGLRLGGCCFAIFSGMGIGRSLKSSCGGELFAARRLTP